MIHSDRLFLNKVTQIFQLDGEIHIVNRDVVGNHGDDGSEIEDADDAEFHQLIDRGLTGSGGDRDNRHFDVMFGDDRGETFHGIQWNFDFWIVVAAEFGIKRADNLKPFLLETSIAQQRRAQRTNPDQDYRLESVRPQEVGNHSRELGDVVAQAPSTELSEVGEILAELRRFDSGGPSEGFATHGFESILPESMQAAQVNAQTVNGLSRNFWTAVFLQDL